MKLNRMANRSIYEVRRNAEIDAVNLIINEHGAWLDAFAYVYGETKEEAIDKFFSILEIDEFYAGWSDHMKQSVKNGTNNEVVDGKYEWSITKAGTFCWSITLSLNVATVAVAIAERLQLIERQN